MNHLKSGMEALLMGEDIKLMDTKNTYREHEHEDEHEEGMEYEGKTEDKPELPSYEALIEMIGLDNIYAMMASKTNHTKQQGLMGDNEYQ